MKKEMGNFADSIVERLIGEGFIVQRYDAYSTDSIYLKLDHGVCNSIRISSHAGKKHLKYRYNIGPYIDEYRVVKDKYDRFYYRADEMEDMISKIVEDRELKLSLYGCESYAGYMLKNRRDKAGTPGFWREAAKGIFTRFHRTYNVGFINSDGSEDETQFDDVESIKELGELFSGFCKENGFQKDTVTYVEKA